MAVLCIFNVAGWAYSNEGQVIREARILHMPVGTETCYMRFVKGIRIFKFAVKDNAKFVIFDTYNIGRANDKLVIEVLNSAWTNWRFSETTERRVFCWSRLN